MVQASTSRSQASNSSFQRASAMTPSVDLHTAARVLAPSTLIEDDALRIRPSQRRYVIRTANELNNGQSSPSSSSDSTRLSASTKDVLFGSIAGMTAKLFEHPFDLVKVRLQTQASENPRYKGAFDCFAQTYGNEGIKGLYRGLSMPIIGAVAENATLFFTYNFVLRTIASFSDDGKTAQQQEGTALADTMSIPQLTMAAAAAGAATSFVLTPVELVKCRMQVQMIAQELRAISTVAAGSLATAGAGGTATAHAPMPAKLEGPVEIVRSTLRSEGIRGLWLGQTGTLLRETGGGIAWFLSFELATRAMMDSIAASRAATALGSSTAGTSFWSSSAASASLSPAMVAERKRQRAQISKKDLSSGQLIAAGALSGVMYNVVLFPADSVKSTIQTEKEMAGPGRMNDAPPSSFVGTFKKIYRTKGIRGLYAGCGITCLRSAPSSALIFLLYNRLEQLADQHGL